MVYLDNNATTRLDDDVLTAMLPYLTEIYGNGSSVQHAMGRAANQGIETARKQVARALSVSDLQELFFTSGATEAINTLIRGVARRYQALGNHIITCQTEHPAVLQTCAQLEQQGFEVTYLPVDEHGMIDLDTLAQQIRTTTILVSIMAANNETGVLHPIAAIAELCQQKKVLFFCDATQYIGKHGTSLNMQDLPIDMLCLSAHKCHGPKGAGALYVRRKSRPIQWESLLKGGHQEKSMRGGTYNVPGIVGLGAALEKIDQAEIVKLEELRNDMEQKLLSSIPHSHINGGQAPRIVNTISLTIKHVSGAELMTRLPGIALSLGSACVAGSRDPSHVLLAMGLSKDDAQCTVRISLSKYSRQDEIDYAVQQIAAQAASIRAQSPVWMLFEKGLLND